MDYRHPVTFLLEAADDIAYSAADIEDGCKKKVLNYFLIKEVLHKHLGMSKSSAERNLCGAFLLSSFSLIKKKKGKATMAFP